MDNGRVLASVETRSSVPLQASVLGACGSCTKAHKLQKAGALLHESRSLMPVCMAAIATDQWTVSSYVASSETL